MPESVTRVFTKYDSMPDEIEVKIPIPNIETPDFSVTDCYFSYPYHRYAMNIGLEGVMFVYYQKVELGGFIGKMEGIVYWEPKENKDEL